MCVLYARITSCLEFKLRILATDDKYKIRNRNHTGAACRRLGRTFCAENIAACEECVQLALRTT